MKGRREKLVPLKEVRGEVPAEVEEDTRKFTSTFRRKPPVSRRRRPKQKKQFHVRFNDSITVNEYEDESLKNVTEEEEQRKDEILKNMFQDESQADALESGPGWATSSAWSIASSVMSASKRLLWFKAAAAENLKTEPENNAEHLEGFDDSKSDVNNNTEEDDSDYEIDPKFNIVYRRSTRQRIRKFSSPNIPINARVKISTDIELPKSRNKPDKVAHSLSNPNLAASSLKPPLHNNRRRYSSVATLSDLSGSSDLLRSGIYCLLLLQCSINGRNFSRNSDFSEKCLHFLRRILDAAFSWG